MLSLGMSLSSAILQATDFAFDTFFKINTPKILF
jgi:hypothetical protein